MDNSVSEFCGSPVTITRDGKDWTFHPLSIADWGKAEGWLKGHDITSMLEATKSITGVMLPDSIRATSMSAIATRQYNRQDCLSSTHGELYLLWLALNKSGNKMSYERMLADLPPMAIREFSHILMQISGLAEPVQEDGDAPLSDTGSTTTTTTTSVGLADSETT